MQVMSMASASWLCGLFAAAALGAPAGIATVGAEQITAGDVEAVASAAFAEQRDAYQSELKQLEARHAREHHQLLEQELERLLDRRALELEAASQGASAAAVTASIVVAAVSDTEVSSFYEANKARIGEPFAQAEKQVRDYLAAEHNKLASRAFYDQLRSRYHIRSELPPHREPVSVSGPSRGRADAPVTIVEFADFQCPYCEQSTSILKALQAKYGDQLRLVFRHLPLVDIHPNALVAARAAVCADQQGKFWPMHDAMFGDQDALDPAALSKTARRLGLDTRRYAACLDADATTRLVNADANAAFELDLSSTPSFLVNGRLLVGSAPEAELDALIKDELQRAGGNRPQQPQ
jgi:protein-disulfide isomerase